MQLNDGTAGLFRAFNLSGRRGILLLVLCLCSSHHLISSSPVARWHLYRHVVRSIWSYAHLGSRDVDAYLE